MLLAATDSKRRLQLAHVHRCRRGAKNWAHVISLSEALLEISKSPDVMLNRAAAVAEVQGAAVALAEIDTLSADRQMAEHQRTARHVPSYWGRRVRFVNRHRYDVAIGLERDGALPRRWHQAIGSGEGLGPSLLAALPDCPIIVLQIFRVLTSVRGPRRGCLPYWPAGSSALPMV
jgi:hypothetical protein